jgi:hypothetical protein
MPMGVVTVRTRCRWAVQARTTSATQHGWQEVVRDDGLLRPQHGCALGVRLLPHIPVSDRNWAASAGRAELGCVEMLARQLPADMKRLLSHGMHRRPEAVRSLTTATRRFAVQSCHHT